MNLHYFSNSKNLLGSFKSKLVFFILALLVNVFWLYVAKSSHNPHGKEFYFTSGVELEKDIYAAEHFLEHGTFYFGQNFRGEDNYTYRMPGHLFVYLPFRMFLSIENTLMAQVIFNVLLGALAALLLALIVLKLTKRTLFFYLAFLLFLGSAYVQHFNFGAAREATTTYVLIIAFYILLQWQEKKKNYLLLIFSVLLTWSILYRAFLVVPVMCTFAFLIIREWKTQKKLPIKLALWLLMPSFLFFGYWIPRNYVLTGKFIPLKPLCMGYAESFRTIPKLITTWGGEVLPWIENGEASWFNPPEWTGDEWADDNLLPDFLFNDTLTLDYLKTAREYYRCAHAYDMFNNEKRIAYDKKATSILNEFIAYQKEEYPFRSHIGAKIKLFGRFLYQPIGIPVRSVFYPLNVILTFTTSFFNLLCIIGGFITSLFLLFKKKRDAIVTLSILFALYLTLVFPLFFNIELRRIAHAIPFFVLNILVFSSALYHKNKKTFALIYIPFILLLVILSIHTCLTYINW